LTILTKCNFSKHE